VGKKTVEKTESETKAPPKLVSRRDHRNSSFKLGRTIGEKREKLETANERAAARKKDKKKKSFRVFITLVGFLALSIVLVVLCVSFIKSKDSEPVEIVAENTSPAPTIEIIDEDAASAGGKITSRMTTYVGQVEQSFRELGYQPVKAVIPSGSIREVDFYLDGYSGYIKMITDRGVGVSVEDADRMIRYLGSESFTYIDVRIDGKAYWK